MPADTSPPDTTPFPPPVAVRPCVLVVDDEPAIRLIARLILEAAGYSVTEAGSAAEALSSVQTTDRSFAVILLDITLPDRYGTDLIPHLRVTAPRSQVILTSGRAEEDVPGHGADGYLAKPFSREQLIAAVRTATAMALR